MSRVIKLTNILDDTPMYFMKEAILMFSRYKNNDSNSPNEFNNYTTISLRSPVTPNEYSSYRCRVKETPEEIIKLIDEE